LVQEVETLKVIFIVPFDPAEHRDDSIGHKGLCTWAETAPNPPHEARWTVKTGRVGESGVARPRGRM